MYLIFSLSCLFWQFFNLENILCGKIVKVKDHVQFYIKYNSESFLIWFADSLGCLIDNQALIIIDI